MGLGSDQHSTKPTLLNFTFSATPPHFFVSYHVDNTGSLLSQCPEWEFLALVNGQFHRAHPFPGPTQESHYDWSVGG